MSADKSSKLENGGKHAVEAAAFAKLAGAEDDTTYEKVSGEGGRGLPGAVGRTASHRCPCTTSYNSAGGQELQCHCQVGQDTRLGVVVHSP